MRIGQEGQGFELGIDVEVLVVGAGPAGCAAAREAAVRGVRVLLVEAKPRVGFPVRCAEYVGPMVGSVFVPSAGMIAAEVREMTMHFPSGCRESFPAAGWMVRRDDFDAGLATRAVGEGAELWTGSRALGLDGSTVRVARGGETIEVRAEVVIGADGPRSPMALWMGNPEQPKAVGVQQTVRNYGGSEALEFHFSPLFPGGYGWVFPKGEEINIGVVVTPSLGTRPTDALVSFLDHLQALGRRFRGPVLRRTGGFIPIGGFRPRLRAGRFLLTGDAAGHTDPLTGGGIHQAVILGSAAGRIAAEAVVRGEEGHLASYETFCDKAFGGATARAVEKRRLLEEAWRAGRMEDEMIRSAWFDG